ncbi:MAG TPA: hypothetical protein GXX38_07175 [Clostridia bacterium]|nr:hypothetical protein [Clostridia bacterium]
MQNRFSKVLLLLVILAVSSGCVNKPQATPADDKEPIINSLSVTPQLGTREEVVLVEPAIKITVDAVETERVDFFIAPAGEESLGESFWVDEKGEDGWSAEYSLPLTNTEYKITVKAYYKDKCTEKSLVVLAEEKKVSENNPAKEQPVELLSEGKKIAQLREVKGMPKYFLAQAWLDNSRFYGQTGTRPVLVNANNFSYKTLKVTSWQSHHSPDGKYISYLNEQGINIVSLDGSSKRWFQPQQNQSFQGNLAGGIWSPDSSKLLFWLEKEWDSLFMVYDLKTSGIKRVNTSLEGYFLTTQAGWIDNDRILFTTKAAVKKDGTAASSSGYRSDLAVADLRDDSYQLITSADDGVFIQGIQIVDHTTAVCQINDGGNTPSSYVFVNLNGSNHKLIPIKNSSKLNVSADGRLAYLTNQSKAGKNQTATLVVEGQNGKIQLAKIKYETISGPFWSPDGKHLLFSITYNKPLEKGFQEEYKTYLVKFK